MEYIENMYITKDAQLILDGKPPQNKYKNIPTIHTDPPKGSKGSKSSKGKENVVSSRSGNPFKSMVGKQSEQSVFDHKPKVDQAYLANILQNGEFYQHQRKEKKAKETYDFNEEFARLKKMESTKSKDISTSSSEEDSVTLSNGKEVNDIQDYMKLKKKGEIQNPEEIVKQSIDAQVKATDTAKQYQAKETAAADDDDEGSIKIPAKKGAKTATIKKPPDDDDDDEGSIKIQAKKGAKTATIKKPPVDDDDDDDSNIKIQAKKSSTSATKKTTEDDDDDSDFQTIKAKKSSTSATKKTTEESEEDHDILAIKTKSLTPANGEESSELTQESESAPVEGMNGSSCFYS